MIQKRPEISNSIIGQLSVRRTLFLLTLNAIFSKVPTWDSQVFLDAS